MEAPTHGLLAKINSSYQNKNVQKLLVIIAKLKKDSLNKKSNCLFGEAMLVKVLSFSAWIKIYQWTRFGLLYCFKKWQLRCSISQNFCINITYPVNCSNKYPVSRIMFYLDIPYTYHAWRRWNPKIRLRRGPPVYIQKAKVRSAIP